MAAATPPVVLLVQPTRGDGLDMYAEFLRHEGLTPIPVSSAEDALTAAPRADVVVTGILLSGPFDGIELIAQLRRSERTRQLPIIVLTACAWDSERQRAELAGCDLFLAKPCLPQDLVLAVRAVLSSSKLRHVRGKPVKAQTPAGESQSRVQSASSPKRPDRK
jgi:DNA-binding response OmpR family regulator